MLLSYPSIVTFPNHWSIITGLYPSHHGFGDNFFMITPEKALQKNKKKNAEDGSLV